MYIGILLTYIINNFIKKKNGKYAINTINEFTATQHARLIYLSFRLLQLIVLALSKKE